MSGRPTGLVTFLFTDIEGSTILSQEFPESLQTALDKHHSILQTVMESNCGFVFEMVGDAFCCAFENAAFAINAAVEVQLALSREDWQDARIKVRIGIHSGEAIWNGKNYSGYITLARTARVMSVAYGEQILISDDTYTLIKEAENSTEWRREFAPGTEANVYMIPGGNRQVSFLDLGERRLKDLKLPLRLFQVTAEGLREQFPPLKTPEARKDNLPLQLTSFVGRTDEVRHVRKALDQTHLLTLTGTGGAGKTRLALQVGASLINDFPDGVWFVELDFLPHDALIENSISKVLGIIEQPKITVEQLLLDYLSNKELLLILDNCEHLINAAAMLVHKLLKGCNKLKIIATSREALRCPGEKIHPVSSLSYPNPDLKVAMEELIKYESVRLFTERASSVSPNFNVNKDNAEAIAHICYQLEGIPLAIELAAARTKTLSIEQIKKRLDDRFSLLTLGNRTALQRQQTLRALVDWSYELLNEKEKTLWSRLSIFAGGWTLEAAEEVCSDDKLSKAEIIDILGTLAEKSILVFNSNEDRYRMLESIRQFGAQKLIDANEYESFSFRHLKYYTELASTANENLGGEEIVHWLNVLDFEWPNLTNALEWSLKNPGIPDGSSLALSLRNYWEIRGLTTEGLMQFESILRESDPCKNELYLRVNSAAGRFYRLKSDYKEAAKLLEKNLSEYRKKNDRGGIADSLNDLGLVAFDKGEYLIATTFFEDSLAIFNEIGGKKDIAFVLNNLGNVNFHRGQYSAASEFYEKSLAIRRKLGEKQGIALSLNGLGLIGIDRANFAEASVYLEESLAINREIGFKHGIAVALNNLGAIAFGQGDYSVASEYYEESLAIRRSTCDKRGIALLLCNLGNIHFELGDYVKASESYRESLVISRDIGDKSVTALSLVNLGSILHDQGNYSEAENLLQESLSIGREIGEQTGIANSLGGLGLLALDKGDYENAFNLFDSSNNIRSKIGDKRGMAISLNNFGNVYYALGKYNEASEFFNKSLNITRSIGDKSGIAESLTGIYKTMIHKGDLLDAKYFLDESVAISRDLNNKKLTSMNLYYLGRNYQLLKQYSEAREYFAQSLKLRIELEAGLERIYSILSLAIVQVNFEDFGRALKLIGFVEHYLGSNRLVLSKSEQELLADSLSTMNKLLSSDKISEYYEAGKELTIEEASELAIGTNAS